MENSNLNKEQLTVSLSSIFEELRQYRYDYRDSTVYHTGNDINSSSIFHDRYQLDINMDVTFDYLYRIPGFTSGHYFHGNTFLYLYLIYLLGSRKGISTQYSGNRYLDIDLAVGGTPSNSPEGVADYGSLDIDNLHAFTSSDVANTIGSENDDTSLIASLNLFSIYDVAGPAITPGRFTFAILDAAHAITVQEISDFFASLTRIPDYLYIDFGSNRQAEASATLILAYIQRHSELARMHIVNKSIHARTEIEKNTTSAEDFSSVAHLSANTTLFPDTCGIDSLEYINNRPLLHAVCVASRSKSEDDMMVLYEMLKRTKEDTILIDGTGCSGDGYTKALSSLNAPGTTLADEQLRSIALFQLQTPDHSLEFVQYAERVFRQYTRYLQELTARRDDLMSERIKVFDEVDIAGGHTLCGIQGRGKIGSKLWLGNLTSKHIKYSVDMLSYDLFRSKITYTPNSIQASIVSGIAGTAKLTPLNYAYNPYDYRCDFKLPADTTRQQTTYVLDVQDDTITLASPSSKISLADAKVEILNILDVIFEDGFIQEILRSEPAYASQVHGEICDDATSATGVITGGVNGSYKCLMDKLYCVETFIYRMLRLLEQYIYSYSKIKTLADIAVIRITNAQKNATAMYIGCIHDLEIDYVYDMVLPTVDSGCQRDEYSSTFKFVRDMHTDTIVPFSIFSKPSADKIPAFIVQLASELTGESFDGRDVEAIDALRTRGYYGSQFSAIDEHIVLESCMAIPRDKKYAEVWQSSMSLAGDSHNILVACDKQIHEVYSEYICGEIDRSVYLAEVQRLSKLFVYNAIKVSLYSMQNIYVRRKLEIPNNAFVTNISSYGLRDLRPEESPLDIYGGFNCIQRDRDSNLYVKISPIVFEKYTADIIYSSQDDATYDGCPVFTSGDKDAFDHITTTRYRRCFKDTQTHLCKLVTKYQTLSGKTRKVTEVCLYLAD